MHKIAVIGLSCLFPGAKTPEQYENNLFSEKDMTSVHSQKQMGVDPDKYYSPKKGVTDKYYSTKGGYIQDFKFDPSGYRLPADVLSELDNVYQWSLYTAKEALKDSGYLNRNDVLKNCGILLGNLSFPTQSSNRIYSQLYYKALDTSVQKLLNIDDFHLAEDRKDQMADYYNRKISGYPAAVIAKALNLSNIQFSLDAACASSLYSVKFACDYLITKKADMMLAGAVSAGDPFFVNQGFSTFTAYSEKDDSRPLNKKSGGLVSGEGAGMFVLKRFEDALRDGDSIYATICGIGLSNDGRGRSVLSPNPKGQVLSYERAYADKKIKPEKVSYIECHATGTPVGDIVELESLENFFGRYPTQPLIGSVKANFGHLLTAAGMASMIKVIISLQKGKIPATINLDDPVSSPKGVISSDQVVNKTTPWPNQAAVKMAAVNAFGFGGTNAHLVFEKMNDKKLETLRATLLEKEQPRQKKPNQKPMAIVGMDAFFGSNQSIEELNYSIYTSQKTDIPLPENRWKGIDKQKELLKAYGFTNGEAPKGSFIEKFDLDVLRYKIPPNEVESMMPQQMLMLKVADKAISDARLKEGANVGVIIAMEADKSLHQFRGRIDLDWKVEEALEKSKKSLTLEQKKSLKNILKDAVRPPVKVNEFTSFIGNIIANRISALWNFTGPSFTISSEENGGYKALQLAQMMLSSGEVDAMVVGGVDFSGNVEDVLLTHKKSQDPSNHFASPIAFKDDEWLVGEGAGAVILKTPEIAKKEKDRCYAVIDAVNIESALSTQEPDNLFQSAFKAAKIHPSDVGYLEISGVSKDPAKEIEGLVSAYSSSSTDQTCAIGSVASNIGHTHAASGIASLIKTTLCIYKRYIPAIPHNSGPKLLDHWNQSVFYSATESRTWFPDKVSGKRIAAIHGISQDGDCAHLILSENSTPKKRSDDYLQQVPFSLLSVKGDSESDLKENLDKLQQQIEANGNIKQIAKKQFKVTRDTPPEKYTLVILGDSKQKVLQEIEAAKKGIQLALADGNDWQSPQGSYFTATPMGKEGKLAFVYPGAFNSYIGMGKDIFQLYPEIYDLIASYTSRSEHLLRDRLVNPRTLKPFTTKELNKSQASLENNAIATFETGINAAILNTAIMRGEFSIEPDIAFGYSMGEVSMTFSLGVWENTDQMSTYLHTQPIFKEHLAGPMNAARETWNLPPAKPGTEEKIWACYTISGPASKIQSAIKDRENVYLIIINSPEEVIVAGETKACREFIESLDYQSVLTPMTDCIHCEVVKKNYDNVVQLHTSPVGYVPPVAFYSASSYQQTEMTSEVIANNIANIYCNTIDFPKLVNRVYDDGARIFLELGPKGSCTKFIDQILGGKPHLAVTMDRKGGDNHSSILRALAKLHSHGVLLDLSVLYAKEDFTNPEKVGYKQMIPGGPQLESAVLSDKNRQHFKEVPVAKAPMAKVKPPAKTVIPKPVAKPVVNIPQTAAVKNASSAGYTYMQDCVSAHRSQISRSHSAFLSARNTSLQEMRERIRTGIIATAQGNGQQLSMIPSSLYQTETPRTESTDSNIEQPETTEFTGDKYFYPLPNQGQKPADVIWNETDLLEFAGGNIANVFGNEFAVIDSYKYRVRLPLPPYLLVHRITDIDAKTGEFKPSSLTTEYDVPINAWYSVDGQIPWAIASEAGQCDLLLISYLGIDFDSKGDRYYRLTDYTMTFMDELPKEGDTLRYEIKIHSFMKSGDALFFDFGYDCYVENRLIYKMTGGRAGFSTDAELALGKGVVFSKLDEKIRQKTQKQHFTPLLNCSKTTFTQEQLLNITRGNISSCFGPEYDQQGANASLRFASEKIMMIDRITSLDKNGGPCGLGEIVAEKDLAPDHWYFPCHFQDDNVLAGTLITEGCVQLLEFYMLYLGLQTNTRDARFQPIQNRPYRIRARGQILPTDTLYSYKMEIIEIGLSPKPFVRANFYIIMNGKTLVDFQDLGIEMVEKAPIHETVSLPQKPTQFTTEHIDEFATGTLSRCFGPEYEIYEGRIAPRTPNGGLQLITRVLEVNGTRHNFKEVSDLISEYDVPADEWFYEQNSCPVMPYSILMEIALQPCGFLSTYMATTMIYKDSEMRFRNLSSTAQLISNVDMRGKTATVKAKLLNVAKAAETIVLNFEYEVLHEGELFYKGTTQFGYFTPTALSMQKGLDRGELILPWFKLEKIPVENSTHIDLTSADARKRYFQGQSTKPFYRLGTERFEFLDEARIIENSGKYGKGYIYAYKKVNPTDWFYPFHFFEDPVMPGSLGIESILQSMRLFALQQDLGHDLSSPCFTSAPGITKWNYRGQITPDNDSMEIEAHIKTIKISQGQVIITADANLWKNGMRIYQITDAAIALVESR